MATIKADRPLCAFLDLIAASEGTSTSPITRADGYDIIVTGVNGPNRFDDYSGHPFSRGRAPILVRHGKDPVYSADLKNGSKPPKLTSPAVAEIRSTASGRYQIILPAWEVLCTHSNSRNFSPSSQDIAAIQLLTECRALDELHAGHIAAAIDKACEIWASFPGNLYQQGGRSLDWLLSTYNVLLAGQGV